MRTSSRLLAVFVVLMWQASAAWPAPQSEPAEDPQLRARAVGLIEHARQLSSPVWPMNEEFAKFHIVDPEPGAATDGSIRIGVARPTLKRWEYDYGTYHLSRVENDDERATLTTGSMPAALVMVLKLLPVNLVRFDQSDIIRSITDELIEGTPANCINFDTVTGLRRESGKLCTDKARGFLIYEKIDDLVIKQSAFFAFNNGFLPGHIERWVNGSKVIDIESKIEVRPNGFGPEYFDYPGGATITHACDSFTPAYADDTPQPPAKSYSDTGVEIIVHGFVDSNGRTRDLKVLDRTYPQLAEEALKLVSTWTFRPAQCDYRSTSQQRDFTVHFQGWQ